MTVAGLKKHGRRPFMLTYAKAPFTAVLKNATNSCGGFLHSEIFCNQACIAGSASTHSSLHKILCERKHQMRKEYSRISRNIEEQGENVAVMENCKCNQSIHLCYCERGRWETPQAVCKEFSLSLWCNSCF